MGLFPLGYDMVFDFSDYLAVRTKEEVNGSEKLYTTRVEASWRFDGSGNFTLIDEALWKFNYAIAETAGVRVASEAKLIVDGKRLLDFNELKIANTVLP